MTKPTGHDDLFADPLQTVKGFQFDQHIVDVFPDMIKRSVPGYATIISMISTLAERYVKADTNAYDLGSSLGAATLAMRHRIAAANCKIISVDNSAAMIDRCQTIIDADSSEVVVQLYCANVEDIVLSNASMVVLNFTLQFIAPEKRDAIIRQIYAGLNPGGVLILSEKIDFGDAQHDQLMIDLHHNFKRANGYSELEVAQKRTALENVLLPEDIAAHKLRLQQAGFKSSDVWFQCFNFASLIAIK
jgi:tRNA (cmo5U34)-methyltransferase